MKVEIWSDIVCPFCYIGKRRFEKALQQFDHSDEISVEWKSFQLDPSTETDPEASINEYLAKTKGWSLEQSRQMNRHVTEMAAGEGLEYNMDQAIVANTFDAHRLIQFGQKHGKSEEAEEALFRAYFTEGKNIDDHETLVEIASDIGLDMGETREVLQSDDFANAVQHDIQIANGLNIRGVPFFLFNRKYAVSGARETEVFQQALTQAWDDWSEENSNAEISAGEGTAADVKSDG